MANSGKLYALFVGITEYEGNRLSRAANNAKLMYDTIYTKIPKLDEKKHTLRILTDANATRAKIIGTFNEFFDVPTKEDVFLFYFTGHGSQEKAPDNFLDGDLDTGKKGMLETILTVDSRKKINNKYIDEIADKELAYIISKITSKGAHFIAIMDCCHSGDNTRKRDDDDSISTVPFKINPRSPEAFFGYKQILTKINNPAHVLIAACDQNEQAQDGFLTAMLLTELKNGGFQKSYIDLLKGIKSQFTNRANTQQPQLHPKTSTIFGDKFLRGIIK